MPGAYGYNPVSMLPLPDLAGNAVLVWYSMLSHNLWWRGSTSYHGTPKLGVINRPTWSSDKYLRMPATGTTISYRVVNS